MFVNNEGPYSKTSFYSLSKKATSFSSTIQYPFPQEIKPHLQANTAFVMT